MTTADFVHLHVHSEYSLLDGANRLDQLMAKARDFGMGSIALTDHGNLFGAIQFYKKAREYGIHPVLGCEVYTAPSSRFERNPAQGIGDSSNHLVLLAENETGYRNLIHLVTAGYLEGFYYRPRVDREILAEHSEGLIVFSGCLKGEIPSYLLQGQTERARQTACWFRDVFGPDRFFLELQDHGLEEQAHVSPMLIDMARKLQIPLVVTNDCHYLNQDDSVAHDVLLCIQTGKTVNDPKRLKFATNQFYVKSPREMEELFDGVPEALSVTREIAERCHLDFPFGQIHLPRYETPPGTNLDGYLETLARKGLEERLRQAGLWGGEEAGRYRERLDEELQIINRMGYAGYFLVVWDFIDYARRQGIPVGPGRGSAAGSLVAYSLRITDLDPIRYGLLFERFLNPERISMPDIDIDFCMERRDEVIDYVVRKYGRENVAQIITFGTMMAKAAVRDVGRAMDMPYGEVDRIAKLIPNRLNITLSEAIQDESRLAELQAADPKVDFLLKTAQKIEGLTRHASTHAAGVVISPRPLAEFVPLYRGSKNEILTQYAMGDIESLGLLKMDFLGLRTLTVIRHTLVLVRETSGVDLTPEELALDDPDTYALLGEARTLGVFQLEGSGLREILRKLKPEVFEDLIALVALYRPGPLGSGMVEDFIRRKHKQVPIHYDHPLLEEILKETYGVILYQEQVMQIASVLAGFSLGEADLLRRAMGKKQPEIMAQQRQKFQEGARSRGIPEGVAIKIFDQMEYFAGYGFNKSHSAAYALVAYWTAYLKAHFSREFMAALLTSDMDNTDKVIKYLDGCREMGIPVSPPDVNESSKDFSVAGNSLRFGLAAVKNVGVAAVENILAVRQRSGPFPSLEAFCQSIDLRAVNRRVIESLIKGGAFDGWGISRAALMADLDKTIEVGHRSQKDRETGQTSLFSLVNQVPERKPRTKPVPEWPESLRLQYEKEALGFYITGHPLARYAQLLKAFTNSTTQTLAEKNGNREVSLGGMVNKLRSLVTKKGDPMGIFELEDLYGSVEVVVFPDVYKDAGQFLAGEEPVWVKGTAEVDGDAVKLRASRVLPLEQAPLLQGFSVHINLQVEQVKRSTLLGLRDLLQGSQGESKVYLHFHFPKQSTIHMLAGNSFRILPEGPILEAIEGLVGEGSVVLEPG
ncbi:MAG: DNA polymerase III subunit alpha [Candidatus Tectomicrobia bacterium]|uniref:DNA polymerase III subunit alpha n=1 Tax=Tectimicrobiota bacterium TaxID=2528274 RepID=A0A932GQ35_UNCTE|nr:DNA polymerase III subunit alpha [Candidatus Tectomicrobia bacterium]